MSEAAELEITFRAMPCEADSGKRWITAETAGAQPMAIGFTRPSGDGFAVHGSADGWPLISVCADETRALGAIIGVWGEQIASTPDEEGEDDYA